MVPGHQCVLTGDTSRRVRDKLCVQVQQSWFVSTSQWRWTATPHWPQKQPRSCLQQKPSQPIRSQPEGAGILLKKEHEGPQSNNRGLQSITQEETQHLVMPMGSGLPSLRRPETVLTCVVCCHVSATHISILSHVTCFISILTSYYL